MERLRRVWVQHDRAAEGRLHWREAPDRPPARDVLRSPSDQHARYGEQDSLQGTGSTVHLTETCEADQPPRMVHVATTPASTSVNQRQPAT